MVIHDSIFFLIYFFPFICFFHAGASVTPLLICYDYSGELFSNFFTREAGINTGYLKLYQAGKMKTQEVKTIGSLNNC